LDCKEIESDLGERFYDVLLIFKLLVRKYQSGAEISVPASQLLSHSKFADGITHGTFGPQQR